MDYSHDLTISCPYAQSVFVNVMELRQLEHVLAVVETGSLTSAAARVGLTQQALSKSLSRLESDIGGKLFERETRGMALTRLGETVVEHARDVVASAGRLKSAAAAELGLERGKLVVGLSPIAATTFIGQSVARFAEAHPNLRIDVEAGLDTDFVAALHRGQIDLALSTRTIGQEDSVLVEQFTNEPWGIAGRIDHPWLGGARSLADLKGAAWVIGRNTDLLDEAIEEAFAACGLARPQPGIVTTSVLFTLTALMTTDRLAILPRSLCQHHTSLMWLDLSNGAWSTPLFLMRRKRAHIGLAARKLLDMLRTEAGEAG
ncbi:transcriptional regulator, LysR family [Hyphomonas neptunium ATCC 15444]|uniref:Transcriptional regulator, LysR family n=2 Tax=Hyphomonas TaxID=85 RepID=Q0C276_HYPNA|nr:transcriptional regulator, LysR family [Hyphomonas neptunium ATCC 15444]